MPTDERDERQNAADRSDGRAVRQRRWRPLVTRRAAWRALIITISGAMIALLAVVFFYRSGRLDALIADQIVNTLSNYNIRAEIEGFRFQLGPRTAQIRNLVLRNATNGALIGRVRRITARVRIEDLFALKLQRNINLETLEVEGLELWVTFDEQGGSNFDGLRLPPPEPNRRILFSYSTARIGVRDSVVHYGDARHELAGDARDLRLTLEPENPQAPAAGWANLFTLAFSNASFSFDGQQIQGIALEARGSVNQTSARIDELILRSPVAEARATGVVEDWRAARYRLDLVSTVDLTRLSDLFGPEIALRGAGSFNGRIQGEGTNYRLEGQLVADGAAIDGVRLQGLNIAAQASGRGASYEARARAVADLLNAGSFRLNMVQLVGNLMGTGTDFRWLGDLRTAALRSGALSVIDLIFRDVRAELRENLFSAAASQGSAAQLNFSSARVSGIGVNGVTLRVADGRVNVAASRLGAAAVSAPNTRVNAVAADGVVFTQRDDGAFVTAERLRVGSLAAAGARTGSLNIAGVRLAIINGRVEGQSGDVDVGTVTLEDGRVEGVRLANPRFVVDAQGRYRASADLSLGGGVLGEIKLGKASGNVVASNGQIQLRDLQAELFDGRASGQLVVGTGRGTPSRVQAEFAGLDVGGLLALLSGRAAPIASRATGRVDLTLVGTDFETASGTVRARLNATGESGATPVDGEIALSADRGLFNIERVDLRAGTTRFEATGRFGLERDSDLRLAINSENAGEFERLVVSTGLIPQLADGLSNYGVELTGRFAFDGSLRGPLRDPSLSGQATLDPFVLNGRDVGTLRAKFERTPTELRVADGRLTERDGGHISFSLVIPREGENNARLDASLERANASALAAAIPGLSESQRDELAQLGKASGRVVVEGFPNAMRGEADLELGPGRIRDEVLRALKAKLAFNGKEIEIAQLDAQFETGRLSANGRVALGAGSWTDAQFDLRAEGSSVPFGLVETLVGRDLPVEGALDFTAAAAGSLSDPRTYRVTIDGKGRGVTINGRPAGDLSLIGRTDGGQLTLELTTGLFGQPQTITARISLNEEELPASVETTLTDADLGPLLAALVPDAGIRLTGRISGRIRASGPLYGETGFGIQALRGTAELSQLAIIIGDTQIAATAPLSVQFSPQELAIDETRFAGPGTNIIMGGMLAIGPEGRQQFVANGEMNLRLFNGLSPNIFFGGLARVQLRVNGTYADPRLTGTAQVVGASFSTLLAGERLTVSSINGTVRFTSNQAQIETLTGRLGGGRLAVLGGALLGVPTQFRFTVRAEDVSVPFPEGFRSTADGELIVQGSTEAQIISGTINLRRAEYRRDIELADLINRRREPSLTEGGGALGATTQLDLRVEGRDALVVRNNLADVIGSVSLLIRGSLEDPVVSGRITATRGTLNFRNDRYDIVRASVDLLPRTSDPLLNIQAETEIRGYRVIVNLNGPLSSGLQATVRSEPALPQADVVSLITTGSLATDERSLSTLSQTGLGTAASLLTDALINARAQRATDRLFGLNRFEIDPLIVGRGGATPTARLTVGRQINRNLSVTYSTNLTAEQNQVVIVEYRVSDRLSFVAQYTQGTEGNIASSRNNNFSFEIRFRKRF